jgi:hypothetical protein
MLYPLSYGGLDGEQAGQALCLAIWSTSLGTI